MTTLGNIGAAIGKAIGGGVRSVGGAVGTGTVNLDQPYSVPTPPPGQPPPIVDPGTPQTADNTDSLLAAIQSALGGGGSFKGSAGSSQAQVNLGLQQQQALLAQELAASEGNAEITDSIYRLKEGNTQNLFGLQQAQLANTLQSNLFNTNASAAASGAYGSAGANLARSDINFGYQNQLQALKDNTYTALMTMGGQQTEAYSKALLNNLKIQQGQAMNNLQRSEAGLP